jgi:hypothetical protein
MDLGVAMARTWWRTLWGAWLAVYAPAALVFGFAFRDEAWLGAVLLWWSKPVFDRFALHVLSRSVFGETPHLRETLGAWRELLRPGLLASLTLHRLNPARSFVLPVWQLERQTGGAARARRGTLQKRLWAYAVWLTVICVHFEVAVLLSTGSVIDLFVPAKADTVFDLSGLASGGASWATWTWADTVAYALAVSAVEPFYVAAGFSLYLDRRMRLEGWDVEVALRRLALRLGQVGTLAAISLAVPIALVAIPGSAQAAPGTPKEEIAAVLKAPEFQTHRNVSTWVYRGEPGGGRDGRDAEFWNRFARILAQIMQILSWTALGVLALASLWFARRLLPSRADPVAPAANIAPPVMRPGRRDERLPEDLPETAAALARQGRTRDALSLLYRGALAALSERHGLAVKDGDTESDCLHHSADVLDDPAQTYFAGLLACWQRAAYSTQPPEAAQAVALCLAWPRHFRSRSASVGS